LTNALDPEQLVKLATAISATTKAHARE